MAQIQAPYVQAFPSFITQANQSFRTSVSLDFEYVE